MNQVIKNRIEDINNGIVPKGYKQTSFGIFPRDWETDKIINDVALCFDGSHETPKYTKEGIPFVSVENIKNIYATNKYISEKDFNEKYKNYPLKNDILMTRIGDIGTPAIVAQDIPIAYYVSLALIRPKNIVSKYLYCAIQGNVVQKSLFEKTLHIAFPKKINLEDIGKCRIVLPKDKSEQSKIAEILMKWDEMVELQEQYIQKLELRKKAIMKKLLTPKDGWKKCKLKDFIKVKSGYAFKSETYVENGKYQILTIKNVQCGLLDLNEISTISELPSNIQKHQILALDDIIISLTGNVGRSCYITKENCLLNQRVGKVECSNVYKQFVYAILQTDDFINAMINIAQGGAQANLSNEDVENFEFFVPFVGNHLDENIIYKLGQINLIIDEEISLQKEKLEKIKIQRKAMQQYLLTGIVRVG